MANITISLQIPRRKNVWKGCTQSSSGNSAVSLTTLNKGVVQKPPRDTTVPIFRAENTILVFTNRKGQANRSWRKRPVSSFSHDSSQRRTDFYWTELIKLLELVFILFHSLTVAEFDNYIEIKFGPGLIKKKFLYDEIESCSIARNKWWYGFGIRKIPGGWLYNVSGLNAIKLNMKNGKEYRIGTDEPQKLFEVMHKKLS